MKGLIITLTLGLMLLSCTNSNKTTDPIKELAFKKFISRQKLIDLPIHFDLDRISDTLTEPLIGSDSDTLFIPTANASGRICGIFKDTSHFFLFIILRTAAVYIPAIVIFDKNGNKIQEEQLLVDGCGADCGYSCNAIADIYKESSNSDILFYARDSVISFMCDSTGKETPGTKEHYVKFISGNINASGHVSKKTGEVDYNKR